MVAPGGEPFVEVVERGGRETERADVAFIGPADSRDGSRTYMQLFTAGIDVVHVTAVPSSGAVGHPQTDSAMLLVRA